MSLVNVPLTLYVVWHPTFENGQNIANAIYTTFCRNLDDPLSRGLGIPVFFRSQPTGARPIPIDTSQSARNAIVVLLDENFVVSDDYNEYAKELSKLVSATTRIYPVQLCSEAGSVNSLNSYQFIRAYSGPVTEPKHLAKSIQKIRTELLHDCARLIINFQAAWQDRPEDQIGSPIQLFLSHAKKDGAKTASRFKAFVDAELKLNVFFDTVDIADGYEFAQQIEENIKKRNVALVVFLTDMYSSREWCRREVITAKRHKCPIVVVNELKSGEERAFPYLGNTPTITIRKNGKEDSFIDIISLTLRQVISNCYQLELLKSFIDFWGDGDRHIEYIASPPELFNYIDIVRVSKDAKKNITVLYPEPPLGVEELQILNEIDNDIAFITPLQLPTL